MSRPGIIVTISGGHFILNSRTLSLTILLLLTCYGCKDDPVYEPPPKFGCTKYYAINYDLEADFDDGSCKFENSHKEGVYVFTELYWNDGFDPSIYEKSKKEYAFYRIPHVQDQWVLISSDGIFDYTNIFNLELQCELIGDSLRFPAQSFDVDSSGYTPVDVVSDVNIKSYSNGYFANDSFYVFLYISGEVDVFIKHLSGAKN